MRWCNVVVMPNWMRFEGASGSLGRSRVGPLPGRGRDRGLVLVLVLGLEPRTSTGDEVITRGVDGVWFCEVSGR